MRRLGGMKGMHARWRKVYTTVWLRNHARLQPGLAKDLQAFFARQAAAVTPGIRKALSGRLNPDDADAIATRAVDAVYVPSDWTARVQSAARPGLLKGMIFGAEAEMELVARPSAKALHVDPLANIEMDVPPEAMAAINRSLRETFAQPYWDGINLTTRQRMINSISGGIENGSSVNAIVRSLEEVLAKSGGEERARAIATTELTSSLNAGHMAVRSGLIEEGLITGSEWSTVLDDVTRSTHVAADGQVTKGKAPFNVGGHKTPYPGHWSLPAGERVRCRCVSVAGGTWAD
jgi:uncharacterized protein with gpF-like domain